MKKRILITLALIATFGLGFAFKSFITNDEPALEKATGIGGIFFKCKDPGKVRAWYKAHLGLITNQYGAVSNGGKAPTQAKRDSPNGARLPKNEILCAFNKRLYDQLQG